MKSILMLMKIIGYWIIFLEWNIQPLQAKFYQLRTLAESPPNHETFFFFLSNKYSVDSATKRVVIAIII